ncbi:MAG: hypothetical protein ACLFR1_15040 [Spirochaetia bacterium]
MKSSAVLLLLAIYSYGSIRSITEFSDTSANRAIIKNPIVLQSEDTLKISQGTELLFSAFTGITVQKGGVLIANGTKDKPIYFTSLQDTAGSASAFDWNGIEIKKDASADLSYCFIAFSTSGISAADSTGLNLEECIFSTNGQWNLSVSGVIKQIPDLQPFSYAPEVPQTEIKQIVLKDTTPAPVPVPVSPVQKKESKINSRSYLLGGVGVLLLTAGSAALFQSHKYESEYNSYVPGNKSFDAATPSARQDHFDNLRTKHTASGILGWSLLGLAKLNLLYLAYTLKF